MNARDYFEAVRSLEREIRRRIWAVEAAEAFKHFECAFAAAYQLGYQLGWAEASANKAKEEPCK